MEPNDFYGKVRSCFSILIDKYDFEPVFELEPAGPFGWSQIIFRSDTCLMQFNVELRELDVGILFSFDVPESNQNDVFSAQGGGVWQRIRAILKGNASMQNDVKWHHIILALNVLGVTVDYDRMFKGIIKAEDRANSQRVLEMMWTEADTIIDQLLEKWQMVLSPYWDQIASSMGNPEFREKVKAIEEKEQHQRIVRFDQYIM